MKMASGLKKLLIGFYYRHWPALHPIRRWEISVFSKFVHGRVLDAGCGNGAVAMALVSRADSVKAFDFSQKFVDACKEYNSNPKIHYSVGNAEAIAFPDGSFDTSLSISVIGQCDKAKALDELVRVTKRGGTAIVTSTTSNIGQLDLKKYAANCTFERFYALRSPLLEALFRPFINFANWLTLVSIVFYPLFWLDAKLGNGKGNCSVLVIRKG